MLGYLKYFLLLCVVGAYGVFYLRGGMETPWQGWTWASPAPLLKGEPGGQAVGALKARLAQWADVKLTVPTIPAFAQQDASAGGHTGADGMICQRPSGHSAQPRRQLYRWVDERGVTHYSDQPNAGASVSALSNPQEDFSYEVVPSGFLLPQSFNGQMHAASRRMYAQWRDFLPQAQLRQSRITLRLLADTGEFAALRGRIAPGLGARTAGFYSLVLNEAVVKYDEAAPEGARRTAIHEISHLITATQLGPTPPWLTEGLAEYFENIAVFGQAGVIYPNEGHLRRLLVGTLPELDALLQLTGRAWASSPDVDRQYAAAWSLVYFLMDSDTGRDTLRQLISEASRHACRPFSMSAALGSAYPGGRSALEEAWHRWLHEAPHKPHRS